MVKYLFKNAQFIKTVVSEKNYPVLRDPSGKLLPEIAVAGRSNVGKSSLLNHLFNSKGLVKTSSTPGKTQALNFFTLNDQLSFVDLPGYGYAEVPQGVRKNWGTMVRSYLEKRDLLKLILFLFDVRRTPNAEDMQLMEWIIHYQKAMILVLTKVDKVNQSEKILNTRRILQAFNYENLHHIHYSTTKNIGRSELIAMISDAIRDEQSGTLDA